ncbi:MAG TPA: hypothetical protein VFQ81_03130 [Candidatus Limnocylindria bacterium]|nr:hypothetical protein [Candidatus Limnocylindria bacterium]
MTRRSRRGSAIGIAALGVAFALALWAPIPTTGNAELARVRDEVTERFPGWRITRASASWENAFTVVASCAGREIGFQIVPEHGLPVGDAWVQPNDEFSRQRLAEVSDHHRYLVWFQHPLRERQLSCRAEMARSMRHTGPTFRWNVD